MQLPTSWTNWPPTASTNVQSYSFLIQPFLALREKYKALGGDWPSPNIVWSSGTITSVSRGTGNAITVGTDNAKDWGTSSTCYPAGTKRWVNFTPVQGSGCSCPPCYLPVNYDLVVQSDENDPLTLVRLPITDQTIVGSGDSATGTLTVNGQLLLDYVTAGFIDSISDLDNATYRIMKQSRGLTSPERLPQAPNPDVEEWTGTGNSGVEYFQADDDDNSSSSVEAEEYAILRDSDPHVTWTIDQWVGYEVLAFGPAGLKRATIEHNDARTLYFEQGEASGIGGIYSIVSAGASVYPGRSVWRPWQNYYGNGTYETVGHAADDRTATVTQAAHTTKYQDGNPCVIGGDCEEQTATIYDVDYQIQLDSLCECNRADDYLAPDLYKSFRQLQRSILDVCGAFVAKSWMPGGTTPPQGYTAATLFHDAGINSGTSSLSWTTTSTDDNGNESGFYSFSVSVYTCPVWWTIVNSIGANIGSGYGAPDSNGVIANVPGSHNNGNTPNDDGATVIYSAGWTRWMVRNVMYPFYGIARFMPDIYTDPDTGTQTIADAPYVKVDEETGKYVSYCGIWDTRSKSSGPISYDNEGKPGDNSGSYTTGMLYRSVGNNYRDPWPDLAPDDILLQYENAFFRGGLSPQNQGARDASRSGAVTDGGKSWLTDGSKNWNADWTSSGGAVHVESGSATAGSSSTLLKDSTKNTTDQFLPHGCWWGTDRFSPSATAYEGFILSIDKTRTLPDPDPSHNAANPQATVQQTVTFKVPITSTTQGASGITISFDSIEIPKYVAASQSWTWETLTIATGDAYRIVEPRYELNKWRDRDLVIVLDDGTTIKTPILYSDQNTLYFAPQDQPIPEGSLYQIVEHPFGTVWQWDGAKFVAPQHDAVRPGVTSPVDFLKDQTCNLESHVRGYGFEQVGDYRSLSWWKEIYDVLNLLKKTPSGFGWVHTTNENEDPDSPEKNAAAYGSYEQTDGPVYFPTDDDRQMFNNRGYGNGAGPEFDLTQDSWEKNYSCNENLCVCEGIREQMFDYGDPFDPDYNEFVSDGPPMRQFGIEGRAYGYHGVDPSGNYLNQPWMEIEIGDFSIDTTFARYAYGKATGIPRLLDGTLTMYIYATIDAGDHDEGSSVTSETPSGGTPGNNVAYSDSTYTFFGAGGASYRQWTEYATVQPDDRGIAYGPKFGDTDGFAIFQGTFEGCPCDSGTCHLESQFPTEFDAPQDFMSQAQGMSHEPGASYYWSKVEYKGYVISGTAAVMDWDMGFMA